MNGIQAMVLQLEALPSLPTDLSARIIVLSKTMSQRQTARRAGVSRTHVYNVLRAAKQREICHD